MSDRSAQVTNLLDGIAALDEALASAVLDAEELALVLESLRILRSETDVVIKTVTSRLHAAMPTRKLETRFGIEEKSNSISRTRWDPALTPRVFTKVLTLCSPTSNPDAMHRLGALLAERIPASFSWRVTGLKEMGFTPDEWCEERKVPIVEFRGKTDDVRAALAEAAANLPADTELRQRVLDAMDSV